MAYPEPNSLDDIYGPGAEAAAEAAHACEEAMNEAIEAGVSPHYLIAVLKGMAEAQKTITAEVESARKQAEFEATASLGIER